MPNMAQLRPRLSPGYFESFAVFFLENESCRFTWKYNQTKLIQRQSLCLFEICYICFLNERTCWRQGCCYWVELHLQNWVDFEDGFKKEPCLKSNYEPRGICMICQNWIVIHINPAILILVHPHLFLEFCFGDHSCTDSNRVVRYVFWRATMPKTASLQASPRTSQQVSKLTSYKMPVIYYDHMTRERCYHNTVIWMQYYFCRITRVQAQQVSKPHFFHHLRL